MIPRMLLNRSIICLQQNVIAAVVVATEWLAM